MDPTSLTFEAESPPWCHLVTQSGGCPVGRTHRKVAPAVLLLSRHLPGPHWANCAGQTGEGRGENREGGRVFVVVYLLSCVRLFTTPWTVPCQASLSTEFSRQEYWSRLTFPSPGDLPNPGIKPESPVWQVDSLPLSYLGSPCISVCVCINGNYSPKRKTL